MRLALTCACCGRPLEFDKIALVEMASSSTVHVLDKRHVGNWPDAHYEVVKRARPEKPYRANPLLT